MAQAQLAGGPRAREYETIYVLRPDVARDAQEKVAGRVSEVVGKEGGRLTQLEAWGRRALAYPVQKHKRGIYVYLKYVGGGAVVNEIERNLRMLDEVLKYQTVKLRDDIEPGTVEVNPENVKFEAVEPPTEAEEEESLERTLGLEDSPEREREPASSMGDGDDEISEDGDEVAQDEEDES
jgi:small subunit ribosomal protein S6